MTDWTRILADESENDWFPLWLMDEALYEEVRTAYAEPQRHYHTWEHITNLLTMADHLSYTYAHEEMWPTLSAAIVFHDIVYDPRAAKGDNERRSAVKAVCKLPLGKNIDAPKVSRMIEATFTHEAHDMWTQRFMDLDMAILCSTGRDYHEYARQVRREYSHVSLDDYVAGRSAFLRSQLDRQHIYYAEMGKWDRPYAGGYQPFSTAKAHNNIAAELGYLAHDPRRYLGETTD